MIFEYDPEKSRINQEKHGVDFEEAQKLWDDEDGLVIPAQSDTEERWALFAIHRDRIWVAFYTIRNESIRIISVRRARKSEEELYDSGRTG
jgi:uncharacterized DUF497 family protein